MKSPRLLTLIAVAIGLLSLLTASAQNADSKGANKVERLSPDLEIQLALSALPPYLRDNATVYVLNPDKGFEVPVTARTDSTPLLLEPATILSGAFGH